MSLAYRVAAIREHSGASSRPAILTEALFTRQNVLDVTGAVAHQLHNWVARGWLTLSGEQNPGRGRKRLYSGCDVISVAFGLELQPFGMMQVADQLSRSQHISARAYRMLQDPAFESGRALAIIPSSELNGWSYVAFGPGTARAGHDFRAAVIIDVDRMILETLERLTLVMRGERISPRDRYGAFTAWSGELIAEDYGDDYLMKPTFGTQY